jgi:protoheme IX farnesyltransferase
MTRFTRNSSPNLPTTFYRNLLLGSAVLAFALTLIGIIQRVTETGMYCLDWPGCSGGWPVLTGARDLIPALHRLFAGLTAVGVLSSGWIAWRRYPKSAWLKWPLALAAGFILVQFGLGRVLLNPNAASGLYSLHFGLSLTTLAAVLVPAVHAYFTHAVLEPEQSFSMIPAGNPGPLAESAEITASETKTIGRLREPFAMLSVLTGGSVFALLISGSWLAANGAQLACSGWLFCEASLVPYDHFTWIHLLHRGFTLLSGTLMGILVVRAWRFQRGRTGILVATTVAGTFYACQGLMGLVEAGQSSAPHLLGLHAATAVMVWIALIVQVAVVIWSPGSAAQESGDDRPRQARQLGRLLKDYLLLTKPVVVSLLLVTTFAGMVVGAKSWPPAMLTLWTLFAGFLAAGGSGAVNQYIDRFDDVKMQRTANRPIPAGRLTAGEGLAFGIAATIVAFYLMVAMVNFVAGMLTLAGTIYYVVLYSILLKKTTVQNIVIGGGAGAIPPLVGWAAATGGLNIPSLFLFAVVFMWTPPHFWALALVRKSDYSRAGVPMLPVVRGERETRWQIFIYTVELVGLTMVLPVFGLGGGIYFVAAVFLGGLLLLSAWRVWRGSGNKVAWKMYRHSSMYLAFLFIALMVDALF